MRACDDAAERDAGGFTATGCLDDAPINGDLAQVETDDLVVGFQADLLELVEDAGSLSKTTRSGDRWTMTPQWVNHIASATCPYPRNLLVESQGEAFS
ncbi:hypothetical protein FHX35_000263 [Auritidibacter ignavus]|nr:hypothetical protein [Auritidibacter ignavus]